MNAQELYEAGKLQEAVTAAQADVTQSPEDGGRRAFLSELLCLTGHFEGADIQLATLGGQDPKAQMGISLFRQLIRAEQARQQFYSEGRLPEFVDQQVTPDLARRLQAAILLREAKTAEAASVLAQAEEERPRVTGTCNGEPFDDLRDLDELTASFFEVLTTTGKYYWIPLERVETVEFRPWTRPRDLQWRRAHMIVRDGPDGEVYLPTLYAGSANDPDDQVRLGRATRWQGENGAPVRGLGQRIFLVGSEDKPILEMQTLSINP